MKTISNKINQNNPKTRDHFRAIYLAIHRIVKKMPSSVNSLLKKIEENNLNLWLILNQKKQTKIKKEESKKVIEKIIAYLDLLKSFHYLHDKNFDLLIAEYQELSEEIMNKIASLNEKSSGKAISLDGVSTKENLIKQKEQQNRVSSQNKLIQDKISQRQKRIINFLRQREKTAVGEILMLLPQVSRRTLYRDLDGLAQEGIIKKEQSRDGRRKIILYRLSKNTE